MTMFYKSFIRFLESWGYRSTKPGTNRPYGDSIHTTDLHDALKLLFKNIKAKKQLNKKAKITLERSSNGPNSTANSTMEEVEYFGMIDRKYSIEMSFVKREASEIVGSYYYVKSGSN